MHGVWSEVVVWWLSFVICQCSDDERIRHHDSLTNSTLQMGSLMSGRDVWRAELLNRIDVGRKVVKMWLPLKIVLFLHPYGVLQAFIELMVIDIQAVHWRCQHGSKKH